MSGTSGTEERENLKTNKAKKNSSVDIGPFGKHVFGCGFGCFYNCACFAYVLRASDEQIEMEPEAEAIGFEKGHIVSKSVLDLTDCERGVYIVPPTCINV